jgi:hypothetical protein
MTPVELYAQVAIEFPSTWPILPEWNWVNVHDGKEPKVDVIAGLLDRFIHTSEVILVVHADPGSAYETTKRDAMKIIAKHLLEHEIQISDLSFSRFLSVSRTGVATGDA